MPVNNTHPDYDAAALDGAPLKAELEAFRRAEREGA
jgi:hypothetical protein